MKPILSPSCHTGDGLRFDGACLRVSGIVHETASAAIARMSRVCRLVATRVDEANYSIELYLTNCATPVLENCLPVGPP